MLKKKYCKVKPSSVECHYCTLAQDRNMAALDCKQYCTHDTLVYELLGFGVNIFGAGYAFVSRNGSVYKVSIDRIYDLNDELEV